jgi:predicted MFS family arabinose efflux permease
MLVVTNLHQVQLAVSTGVVGALMLTNAGRMAAALSMITGSVERRFRGGFMSANSAVQHLSSGLGAYVGGQIITQTPGGTLEHFPIVGLIAAVATLASLGLAVRIRQVKEPAPLDAGRASRVCEQEHDEAARRPAGWIKPTEAER